MEAEPKVSLVVRKYVEIQYKDQKLILPLDESSDIVVGIAKLLPDDAGASS